MINIDIDLGVSVGVDIDIDIDIGVGIDIDLHIDVGIDIGIDIETFQPGCTALWISLTLAPGYDFDNFLDWPQVLFINSTK